MTKLFFLFSLGCLVFTGAHAERVSRGDGVELRIRDPFTVADKYRWSSDRQQNARIARNDVCKEVNNVDACYKKYMAEQERDYIKRAGGDWISVECRVVQDLKPQVRYYLRVIGTQDADAVRFDEKFNIGFDLPDLIELSGNQERGEKVMAQMKWNAADRSWTDVPLSLSNGRNVLWLSNVPGRAHKDVIASTAVKITIPAWNKTWDLAVTRDGLLKGLQFCGKLVRGEIQEAFARRKP